MSAWAAPAVAGLDGAPVDASGSTPGAPSLAAQGPAVAPAASTTSLGAAAGAAAGGGNDATVLAHRRPPKGRNVLRCWQEGKLIFEAAGVQAPTGRNAEVLDFRPAGSDGSAVQVLDLKQGLCTFEAQRP